MTRYKDNVSDNKELDELAKEIDMNPQTNTGAALSGATMSALEDMLDDLDLDSLDEGNNEIEEIIASEEIIEDTVTDEQLEEVDADALDLAMEREDVIAEQESEIQVAENATEAKAEAKANGAKPSKKAASTAPKKPRAVRDINDLDAKVFVLEGDAAAMSDDDLATNKLEVIAAKPEQKKIGEKFVNLFVSLNAGKQPSVYITQAFKMLEEKKTFTGAELTAMLKVSYDQGTAQSQSGQIMTLFAAVKIATRNKNSLTLNDNSVVAERLRKIYEDAAAAA